jgi:phosphatidylglycerol:prolipoprotein diacylglycerol transferase
VLKSPGAVAFSIGNISVYWYGIIIALAFISGLLTSLYFASKDSEKEETKNHILDLSTLLLAGGVISARIYYVIFNLSYYSNNPAEIFMTWKGGLSIHGAIIGGILITYFYTKTHKLNILKYTDLLAYGTIMGQAIGRWGNFFNSEAFGTPTNLPWKMYIPPENRPFEFIGYQYFHPTFLYESLWNLLVFIMLITFIRKHSHDKTGIITSFYLILYSLGRFFIEGMRTDSIYSLFGIHIAQFASILIFISGLILLYMIHGNKKSLKN